MSRTMITPGFSIVIADALRIRAATLETEAEDHIRNGGKSVAMSTRADAERLRVLADSMFNEHCAIETRLSPPNLGPLPK